jgi:hypothetical protein
MICDISDFINQSDFNLRLSNNNKWQELLSNKGLEEKFINKDESFIIKYKKNDLSKENYSTIGKLRSIVCNDTSILSFSPPKCLDFNEFINKYPCHDCFAEDYIEGTMITAYFNKKTNKWEISSKSAIGASVYKLVKIVIFPLNLYQKITAIPLSYNILIIELF